MHGLMQEFPLLVTKPLQYAEIYHSEQEVVSRRAEGDIHRYGYRELGKRARRLAGALEAIGIEPGDRVGTLALNGYRHMELYFAIRYCQRMAADRLAC